jgi:hypothetical protein
MICDAAEDVGEPCQSIDTVELSRFMRVSAYLMAFAKGVLHDSLGSFLCSQCSRSSRMGLACLAQLDTPFWWGSTCFFLDGIKLGDTLNGLLCYM